MPPIDGDSKLPEGLTINIRASLGGEQSFHLTGEINKLLRSYCVPVGTLLPPLPAPPPPLRVFGFLGLGLA